MLRNNVAVVTGASRGIGRAIAIELGRQGAIVIGTATTESGAQAIDQYLRDGGVDGFGAVLNVNDAAQIESVLKTIQDKFGDIAILVNNAKTEYAGLGRCIVALPDVPCGSYDRGDVDNAAVAHPHHLPQDGAAPSFVPRLPASEALAREGPLP